MNGKNISLMTIAAVIIIALSNILWAQGSPQEENLRKGKLLAEEAYMRYDEEMMKKAREIFQQACSTDKKNMTALYYLTYADYKLFEMSLRSSNDELFDRNFDSSVGNAEILSGQKGWESEAKTLLSALYMMKIAKKPMTAVYLSPKIWGLLDEAKELNPQNPRVYIIRGSMKFNTPKMFGGSYEDAADNFRQAVSLFEKQTDTSFTLKPGWGYPESLAWLGRSLEEQENYEPAKFVYKKALSIQPSYGWVKYVLLPNLEKKMKNGN